MMYIANDLPPFRKDNRKEYIRAITDRISELCDITEGRTLVLFTAKEDMNQVFDILSSRENKWELYKQVEGSFQESVISQFRESKGVLLGAGIFWEGINIKGYDLSQVIVVRLPFPVPTDPVMEYKIGSSADHLNEVLLPEMIIKLRQGTGRLIRSERDKGIISILDPRLSIIKGRKYREEVLDSLPFKTITESLGELKPFWGGRGNL